MRHCPFCSAENPDIASQCSACGRRLPPLPRRPAVEMAGSRAKRSAETSSGRGAEMAAGASSADDRSAGAVAAPTPGTQAANRLAASLHAAASDWQEPPPTRVPLGDSGRRGHKIQPIPEVPEAGILEALRYTLAFARARWQRRAAIKDLTADLKEKAIAMDQVLGLLGEKARALAQDSPAITDENRAIDEAEARRERCEHANAELRARGDDENRKFAALEAERKAKVAQAGEALQQSQRELGALEAQRRGLREQRKTVERTQRGYLKAADDREDRAAKAGPGAASDGFRRSAEELRRDAAALDPERQDIERRLAALDGPIAQAAGRVDALKAEQDSARRSLNDAREGHRHRLAELEAEAARGHRQLAEVEGEIQRRLVTLGTLINLHRIPGPEFAELYQRIDDLRAAITARSSEIDQLTVEGEAFDKASLIRGLVVLAAGMVMLMTLVAIFMAIF